jgi:hypothetical protein
MPTKGQLAAIHAGKRDRGLDDETYRMLLREQGGVDSAKDLDDAGVDAVLTQLRWLGFPARTEAARPAQVKGSNALPSRKQLWMLRQLFAELEWTEAARREGFCKRLCGKPWPQTRAEASVLIEALKNMHGRGYSERAGREVEAHG